LAKKKKKMSPAERMRYERTILDPEIVGSIWEEEGSHAKVSDRLVKAGVVNPATGRPYSRMSISRAVKKSSAWLRAQERFATAREALERARR
jgi:hypothetical protein